MKIGTLNLTKTEFSTLIKATTSIKNTTQIAAMYEVITNDMNDEMYVCDFMTIAEMEETLDVFYANKNGEDLIELLDQYGHLGEGGFLYDEFDDAVSLGDMEIGTTVELRDGGHIIKTSKGWFLDGVCDVTDF